MEGGGRKEGGCRGRDGMHRIYFFYACKGRRVVREESVVGG